MLQALRIQNFQTHERLSIELDPQVTTIVGSSDSGKSAIVRAMGLLCLNRPQGYSFVRRGGKETRITLYIGEHFIQRRRGKGTNEYRIDKRTLKAFGAEVPTEVQKRLRISEHNFQFQLDPPFWFSRSAPEVSRALNAVVGFEVMDSMMSTISKALRQARFRVAVAEKELEKFKEELEALRDVPEIDEVLQHLESLAQELLNETRETSELLKLTERVTDLQEKNQDREEYLKDLQELNDLAEITDVFQSDTISLESAILMAETHEKSLSEARRDKEEVKSQLSKIKTCPLCGSKLNAHSRSSVLTCTSH